MTRDHQLVAAVKKTVDDLAKDAQVVTDQIKAVYIENDRDPEHELAPGDALQPVRRGQLSDH